MFASIHIHMLSFYVREENCPRVEGAEKKKTYLVAGLSTTTRKRRASNPQNIERPLVHDRVYDEFKKEQLWQ